MSLMSHTTPVRRCQAGDRNVMNDMNDMNATKHAWQAGTLWGNAWQNDSPKVRYAAARLAGVPEGRKGARHGARAARRFLPRRGLIPKPRVAKRTLGFPHRRYLP